MLKERPILLIEDDVVDIMTVRRALKDINANNRLDSVHNGEEALEYLTDDENEIPGIILLDLNMPKMNGIEFMEALEQNSKLKKIPIVVITTSDNENDKIKSFKFNICGYMIKPVEYLKFVEMIKTIREYWAMSEEPEY